MQDSQVIEQLLSGYTLYSSMEPDPSIPTNHPLHMECFSLPFILLREQRFWARTRAEHAVGHFSGRMAFNYLSWCNLFFSYSAMSSGGALMSLKRYRKFEWILKHEYDPIWDSSDKHHSLPLLVEAIQQAKSLRVALLLDNTWHLYPVHLPMYHPENQSFVLKICFDRFPSAFQDFSVIDELYQSKQAYFDTLPKSNEDGVKCFQAESSEVVREVRSEGCFRFTTGALGKRSQELEGQYDRLVVFAQRTESETA